jgi:hypothetical protein
MPLTVFVDLDGVVCTEETTFERALAEPLPGAREGLTALSAAGHTVVIHTARSWSEYRMTKAWLEQHDLPFDAIQMGKPVADVIVDDRAIRFTDWDQLVSDIAPGTRPDKGFQDESLLRLVREGTRDFLREIAARTDLLEPILEVGPMTRNDAENSPVFERMPDTFVDSRELFAGRQYKSLDIDASAQPDVVGDFANADQLFEPESVGTVILMSCLEHMPRVWDVPKSLARMLKPGGRAFMLTPWNLRFHGPRPDCWRISDDGYRALFEDGFQIESIDTVATPGRPLSPAAMRCVVRKHAS